MNTGIKWPVVVITGILVSGFIGIFALIPDDEPESRTMLLTAVTGATSAVVLWFINRKTNELGEKVTRVERATNGNLTRIIEKIPDPNVREVEARRHEARTEDSP